MHITRVENCCSSLWYTLSLRCCCRGFVPIRFTWRRTPLKTVRLPTMPVGPGLRCLPENDSIKRESQIVWYALKILFTKPVMNSVVFYQRKSPRDFSPFMSNFILASHPISCLRASHVWKCFFSFILITIYHRVLVLYSVVRMEENYQYMLLNFKWTRSFPFMWHFSVWQMLWLLTGVLKFKTSYSRALHFFFLIVCLLEVWKWRHKAINLEKKKHWCLPQVEKYKKRNCDHVVWSKDSRNWIWNRQCLNERSLHGLLSVYL